MKANQAPAISHHSGYVPRKSGIYVKPPAAYLRPGILLAKRYRLEERLSTTIMSEVFIAKDEFDNGREVIVKIANFQSNLKEFKRKADCDVISNCFKIETEILSGEYHSMFPAMYESGEYEGRPFIVMEHIKGKSLHELFHSRQKITLRQAFNILLQVLAGLKALHDNGWVYRDLKPANIIVCGDQIRLIDFNLACRIKGQTPGRAAGTLSYFSPEQARNQPCSLNSDIYSLGLIFNKLLTGTNPMLDARESAIDSIIYKIGLMLYKMRLGNKPKHKSEQAIIIRNQRKKKMPPFSEENIIERIPAERRTSVEESIREVHELIQFLIATMTEKRPDRRFQSADEMITFFQPLGITLEAIKPEPT